jgi:hypothetical protein
LRLADIRLLAGKLLSGQPWSQLRTVFRSLLSWPTDVAWRRSDDAIFATEARALVRIRPGAEPERICEPVLAFNFNGIDVADDGAVVGVEQGIGQAFSWGRVQRFDVAQSPVAITRSSELEGQTRLMSVCFAGSLRKVVVAQALTWPLGAIIFLDYPTMSNARIVRGFDMPGKLAYLAGGDLLAVSTRSGVMLHALEELHRCAQPLAARPKLLFEINPP